MKPEKLKVYPDLPVVLAEASRAYGVPVPLIVALLDLLLDIGIPTAWLAREGFIGDPANWRNQVYLAARNLAVYARPTSTEVEQVYYAASEWAVKTNQEECRTLIAAAQLVWGVPRFEPQARPSWWSRLWARLTA